MELHEADVKAIDAVVNIWTPEALSHRPDWKDGFFAGKVKAKSPMSAVSLEQMLERMAEAGIERGFLVAARTGRLGLPGSYHMPYEVVARACENAVYIAAANRVGQEPSYTFGGESMLVGPRGHVHTALIALAVQQRAEVVHREHRNARPTQVNQRDHVEFGKATSGHAVAIIDKGEGADDRRAG